MKDFACYSVPVLGGCVAAYIHLPRQYGLLYTFVRSLWLRSAASRLCSPPISARIINAPTIFPSNLLSAPHWTGLHWTALDCTRTRTAFKLSHSLTHSRRRPRCSFIEATTPDSTPLCHPPAHAQPCSLTRHPNEPSPAFLFMQNSIKSCTKDNSNTFFFPS
jgi:hypothetical protein